MVKTPPGLESFASPNPEAGGDAYNHGHEVLDDEDGEVRAHRGKVGGASDGIALAGLQKPGFLPGVSEGLLVEVAGQHNGSRHRVQDTEDSNSDHELLQLLCLSAIVLHDGPNAEEGDKASQQEGGAYEEVDKEWGQHKTTQGIHAVDAHVADATEHIPINLPHR